MAIQQNARYVKKDVLQFSEHGNRPGVCLASSYTTIQKSKLVKKLTIINMTIDEQIKLSMLTTKAMINKRCERLDYIVSKDLKIIYDKTEKEFNKYAPKENFIFRLKKEFKKHFPIAYEILGGIANVILKSSQQQLDPINNEQFKRKNYDTSI